MVLIDGVKRACVTDVAKLEGKAVVTVEGLTARERAVYALLRRGGRGSVRLLHPRHGDQRQGAIGRQLKSLAGRGQGGHARQHLPLHRLSEDRGRHLAGGGFFREDRPVGPPGAGLLGDDMPRVDAAAKVLGEGLFADDMTLPGMLHAKALRSRYPRARVVKIDLEAALRR